MGCVFHQNYCGQLGKLFIQAGLLRIDQSSLFSPEHDGGKGCRSDGGHWGFCDEYAGVLAELEGAADPPFTPFPQFPISLVRACPNTS